MGIGMTPGAIDRDASLERGPPFGRPALEHLRASHLAFRIGALRVAGAPALEPRHRGARRRLGRVRSPGLGQDPGEHDA